VYIPMRFTVSDHDHPAAFIWLGEGQYATVITKASITHFFCEGNGIVLVINGKEEEWFQENTDPAFFEAFIRWYFPDYTADMFLENYYKTDRPKQD